MRRCGTRALAVVTALATFGCQPPPKKVPPPPPPPPAPTVAQARSANAARFHDVLQSYDGHLAQLPGHSGSEHRAASAAALGDLAELLRQAYGAGPSPGFASDVRIVDAAAATVGTESVPRSRMEAAENQAVLAAVAGLREVASRVLFDDAALPPLLDAATAKVDAARATQGPLHDGDATDALAAIGAALHRVGDDLTERFANVQEPVVATPAPMLTPMATTIPASMPATLPATTMP